MFTFSRFFFILLFASFSSLGAIDSDKAVRMSMVSHLDFIKSILETGYGPFEWKQQHVKWDLEQEITSTKMKILNSKRAPSHADYRVWLKQIFNSTKDYHTGLRFFSTEYAILPFDVRSSQARYFFTYVDSDLDCFPKGFPFEVGDELLSINDVPIEKIIAEFKETELGSNNDATDSALAEIYLTSRFGKLGQVVPSGQAIIKGRKGNSKAVIKCKGEWIHSSEKILPILTRACLLPSTLEAEPKKAYSIFRKNYVIPQYEVIAALHAKRQNSGETLGARVGFLPQLGKVIWETDEQNPFQAYVFLLPSGKKAGYLRIGTYEIDSPEKYVDEFKAIIAKMQQEADILVIDQMNNPGGYILYVYALAAHLSDKPLKVPSQRVMLTNEDVYWAHYYLSVFDDMTLDEMKFILKDSLCGYPLSTDLSVKIKEYFTFICKEWQSGRRFTLPFYEYGISEITPNVETRFNKPLLLLINELDFSGGDFFPAIMQDNKRALIMGKRTAGAGGYFLKAEYPNQYAIRSVHYTASIAERLNGTVIENQGVTPDIHCELTINDLRKNYVDYTQKIVDTLESMIVNPL